MAVTAIEVWAATHMVASLLVGGGFLLSGVAKMRDSQGTAETFEALKIPAVLNRSWIHRLYPWAELLLGIGVLFAPAYAWWPIVLLAAATMAVLAALVLRIIAARDAVECNCFGTRQPVTWRTATRNLLFLAFSALLLAHPLSAPAPLWTSLQDHPVVAYTAILAVVGSVALAALSQGGNHIPADAETYEDRILEVPDLPLLEGDGTEVRLPTLVKTGPVLLIYVKHGCGSCKKTEERFKDGDKIAGRVTVRLLERTPPTGPDQARSRLWDGHGVARTLAMQFTPAALLLAADGTIPMDPVYGPQEIGRLAEGIEEAVAQATPPPLNEIIT